MMEERTIEEARDLHQAYENEVYLIMCKDHVHFLATRCINEYFPNADGDEYDRVESALTNYFREHTDDVEKIFGKFLDKLDDSDFVDNDFTCSFDGNEFDWNVILDDIMMEADEVTENFVRNIDIDKWCD